jgi:hypothetical protein
MLVLLFLGCGTLFAETHFSVGIGIGGYGPVYAPVPPPPPDYEQPPCPGEGYIWVDGYWNPLRGHYYWRPGYWRAPAYYGYRGGRGYDRGGYGYAYRERDNDRGGYAYRERGYDHHDRDRRDWDRGNRGGYGRNEFRHDEGRGRHEERDWRR